MGSLFVDKLAKSVSTRVYGLRQTDETGYISYYFIEIDPAKEKAFLRMLNGRAPFLIEDYGTLLSKEADRLLSSEVINDIEKRYKVAFVHRAC
jgi:hypothetical protein